MKFWEKWFWATYVRGQDPFKVFLRGLVAGIWIPVMASAVFCLFTDPQFKNHSLKDFSLSQYLNYYVFFWTTVFQVCWSTLQEYASFTWNSWDQVVNFTRRVLWLD